MKAKLAVSAQRLEAVKQFYQDQLGVKGTKYSGFVLKNIHSINMFVGEINEQMDKEVKTKYPKSETPEYKDYLAKHKAIFAAYDTQEKAMKFKKRIDKAIGELNEKMPEQFKLSNSLNLYYNSFQQKELELGVYFIKEKDLPEIDAKQRAVLEIFIVKNKLNFLYRKRFKGFKL
jgi:hypothetical protein